MLPTSWEGTADRPLYNISFSNEIMQVMILQQICHSFLQLRHLCSSRYTIHNYNYATSTTTVTPLLLQQLRHLCCSRYAIRACSYATCTCSSYATSTAADIPLMLAVTPLLLQQLRHSCLQLRHLSLQLRHFSPLDYFASLQNSLKLIHFRNCT